jgi:hypothetical protein
MAADIASRFGLPDDLMPFLTSGMLEVLNEDDDRHTVEFSIPSLRRSDEHRRITAYALTIRRRAASRIAGQSLRPSCRTISSFGK